MSIVGDIKARLDTEAAESAATGKKGGGAKGHKLKGDTKGKSSGGWC